MKVFLASLIITIAFVFALSPAVVSGEPVEIKHQETKQLMALVRDASDQIAQKGEAAFADFRKKGSKWLHDDTYVFVIDPKGYVYLNPNRPELEGKNQKDLKDAMGKYFIKWFIKETTEYPNKREGWSHYVWFKPGEEMASWKTSYVKYVKAPSGKEYIVGSGLYNMKPEKVFVIDIVEEAEQLVQKDGKKAFPMLRDKMGEFNYLTTYVFVIDQKGYDLVNPAFPNHEGNNVLDLKDADGKFFIRDIMKMLEKSNAGWITYQWPKPGQSKPSPKETYVKKVVSGKEVFYVGSGIYLE